MASTDSFQTLLAGLRDGAEDAATAIFRRFVRRLVLLARSQLDSRLRHKADPEEVVQSVFKSFFARHQAGQFELTDWESLWGLLAVMTLRKCHNQAQHLRAACRDVRREVSLPPAEQDRAVVFGLARDPTPAEAAVLTDTLEHLMRGLEPRERDILVLHLQGYTLQEISDRVGRAQRTVRRVVERVRKRLRRLQTNEVSS
jgi:RNA polymerase sigma-70 factor (ECF subfamily)